MLYIIYFRVDDFIITLKLFIYEKIYFEKYTFENIFFKTYITEY